MIEEKLIYLMAPCCYGFEWSAPILIKTLLWLSQYTLNLSCSELEDCHLPLTLGCHFFKLCKPCDLLSCQALLR